MTQPIINRKGRYKMLVYCYCTFNDTNLNYPFCSCSNKNGKCKQILLHIIVRFALTLLRYLHLNCQYREACFLFEHLNNAHEFF